MESLFKVLFLVILDCNDCNSFHISDSFSHRYVFFWFLTGISQEDYRAAVRAGADIVWFCPSCSRPDADPVAESTRITESETDILESEEFNPPLPSSDSDLTESTVYEPPAQPALDESTIDDPMLLCQTQWKPKLNRWLFSSLTAVAREENGNWLTTGDTVITWRGSVWMQQTGNARCDLW